MPIYRVVETAHATKDYIYEVEAETENEAYELVSTQEVEHLVSDFMWDEYEWEIVEVKLQEEEE